MKKKTTTLNPAIVPVEAATRDYSDALKLLTASVENFEREVEALRRLHLPTITAQAKRTKECQSALESLIIQKKDLFEEPRTIVLHGIRVGLQKGKGKVEFDDADKVVDRIRAQFPKAQAELLLDVKTTPRKDALLTLDASALKKLGVTITGTGDSVVIKATGGDLDKLVARILEEKSEQTSKKEAA